MKKICILILLFPLLTTSIRGQQYDLFPLCIGNKFVYEYSSYDTTYWVGMFDHIQIDSGEVAFFVTDSSLIENNNIEWSISQISHLQRYNKQEENTFWGIDSTYMVMDTISLKLYESLLGRHKITCDAITLNDTLSMSMNNEIRIWQFLDYREIYRYSNDFEDSIITNRDTLLFRHKTGLFKRSDYFFQETHHSGPIGFNAKLKDYFVSVKNIHLLDIAKKYNTINNYPNPFNISTIIEFELSCPSNVNFSVFNINGQVVHQESFGIMPIGKNHIYYNGKDISSGQYLYQIVLKNNFILRNKFVFLK